MISVFSNFNSLPLSLPFLAGHLQSDISLIVFEAVFSNDSEWRHFYLFSSWISC